MRTDLLADAVTPPPREPQSDEEVGALKHWANARGIGSNPWLAAYLAHQDREMACLRSRLEQNEAKLDRALTLLDQATLQ